MTPIAIKWLVYDVLRQNWPIDKKVEELTTALQTRGASLEDLACYIAMLEYPYRLKLTRAVKE